MKRKIIYILMLIALIGLVIFCVVKVNSKRGQNQGNNIELASNRNKDISDQEADKKKTTKTVLEDGTLYSIVPEKVNSDVVIGDNYFDTQINDMMFNSQTYNEKNIEIEGLYLESEPYTFVGRYSTVSLCPYCSAGYSYIEYQWDGDPIDLEMEKSWIKVVGTLEKENDETSYNQDYYYIKAKTIEVMNEKGQDTVNN